MQPSTWRSPTIEDWLAIPEERRAELIDGAIFYQGMPGPSHGRAQGKTFAAIDGPFGRRPGGAERPGGWWISLEVDMEIGGIGCRPDLGWRRERLPRMPEPDERGVVMLVGGGQELVRAPPFEAIDISVAEICGVDD